MDAINTEQVAIMDELFHEDAVMDWPQSGERIVGGDNRRSVYGAFPALPRITPRRMRVLLVEADPCGYSAILAGPLAARVPVGAGVLDAAMAAREGRLAQALPAMLVQLPGTRARVLPGLASVAQRGSLTPAVWLDLAAELRTWSATTGTDLLIDAGPLTDASHPAGLHCLADLVCLVTRPDLVGVSSARNWADTLADALPDPARLRLVVVGGHPAYSGAQVAHYLGLPLLADLGNDPVAAAHYSGGDRLPRRHRGPLTRSLPAAASALLALAPEVADV